MILALSKKLRDMRPARPALLACQRGALPPCRRERADAFRLSRDHLRYHLWVGVREDS